MINTAKTLHMCPGSQRLTMVRKEMGKKKKKTDIEKKLSLCSL